MYLSLKIEVWNWCNRFSNQNYPGTRKNKMHLYSQVSWGCLPCHFPGHIPKLFCLWLPCTALHLLSNPALLSHSPHIHPIFLKTTVLSPPTGKEIFSHHFMLSLTNQIFPHNFTCVNSCLFVAIVNSTILHTFRKKLKFLKNES